MARHYFAATDGKTIAAVCYGSRWGWVVEVECASLEVAERLAREMNEKTRMRAESAFHVQAMRRADAVMGRATRHRSAVEVEEACAA